MKQVIQNFKTGDLYVDEVPIPSISQKMVLVENKFSLISAGTERGTVKVGKASLIGKAKQRPDLVAQVFQNIKKEGISATLDKVRTKLDSLKALGYSTSGIVKASLDSEGYYKPGDRVACAGQDYASHADFVSVPQNLVAKIPDNVSFEEASFTTLGAIALQGVRQAEPKIAENICVIGLGLLGQLTCQILKANGCNVFGIDLSRNLIDLANETNSAVAYHRNDSNLLSTIESFTNGHGFDSIIITAATHSNDPIELSAEISRKKGRIVVVGAVKMDIPRDPHFYRKELELRISTSYGPGRYDTKYEEEGHDYPYGYIRWTEQRNMEAFLQLISQGHIKVKPLITHIFDIEEANKAYDIVLGKVEEPHIGLLLKYAPSLDSEKSFIEVKASESNKINVGFIGAGSFAQSYLIPTVKKNTHTSLDTVVTSKGITSKNVAEKFGFNKSSATPSDVLENKRINTVFIATPHNTHASLTIDALKNNKHVFVEKPIALKDEELKKVKEAYEQSKSLLMVGFNRRFSPIAQKIKENFKGIQEPLVFNFRVNAGFLPKDHWSQVKEIGGGRIIGEVCHFIDLMQYFTDSIPINVYANCIDSSNSETTNTDNVAIVIKFKDGSVGNLVYLGNGDKSLAKEHLEIFGGGAVGVIEDFKQGKIYKNGKVQALKIPGKGHRQEVEAFLDAINLGKEAPISFESIYYTTSCTFRILDSIATGFPQNIEV